MKKLAFLLSFLAVSSVSAQSVTLTEFATGFTAPVEITNSGDSRLFVVQQNGIIKIVQPNGSVNATDFLNISSIVNFGGERGLLGLAFHPQYATNGYFYVYYNNTAGNIIVARYSRSTANPDVADPSSALILLNIPKPFANHNGGSMHFAPDGKLWISTGDGGSAGDPNGNAQNINSLLGKMLRIDVNASGYTIPADNPFAGATAGSDEIWSYGLRNAWKFSFDTNTGNVMIADVGQGVYEEINKIPISQPAVNYGWRCYEANATYNTAGCGAAASMTFPVAAYDHSGGKCSITGGYVYRGTLYPAFTGKYLFADYCSQQIGLMHADNSITWTSAFSGNNFSTFGQDAVKELYVAAVNNGKIFKISTTTLSTAEGVAEKITVYPNPVSQKLFVKGLNAKNVRADFISADGRLAGEKFLENDNSFTVSDFSPGVYFITIKSEGQKIYSQKIVIK